MTLEIQHEQSLSGLNTLGLDTVAEHLVRVTSEDQICEMLAHAKSHRWPVTVLGGGSNMVLTRKVRGLVMLVAVPGIHYSGRSVHAGAGETWHKLVLDSLDQDLSGIENLSLIPGSVGAAPIQNIGAYGAELSDVLESVTAIDRETLQTITLSKEDCRLGYRDSIFKHELKERMVISQVELSLHDDFVANLDYEPLRTSIEAKEAPVTARLVSETVSRIRQSKLPDPARIGNVGSFFKNPVLDANKVGELRLEYPGLPSWETPSGTKVSAAWLIEQCGLKGETIGGAAVSPTHALVIINRGGATGEDVMALAGRIQSQVDAHFGIHLEIEPVVY